MNWRASTGGKTPPPHEGAFARVRLVRAWIAVFYALIVLAYLFLKLLDFAL